MADEEPMSDVRRYGSPYRVAARFRVGELTEEELVAILSAWPYRSSVGIDEDDAHNQSMSPGSFAAVRWALRDGLIGLPTYRAIAEGAAQEFGRIKGVETRAELMLADTGRWQVSAERVHYDFDLDVLTVRRREEPLQYLRAIQACRVQERGMWIVYPPDSRSERSIHLVGIISQITRLDMPPGDNA